MCACVFSYVCMEVVVVGGTSDEWFVNTLESFYEYDAGVSLV